MTTTRKVLIEARDTPTAQTALYTAAAGVTATIDKLTITNTTAGVESVSVNTVPPAGTVGSTNLISKTVSIAAGAYYGFPEIVGHDISPGGALSFIASAPGLTVRASGRETTSG